jgi:putative tricarboxylic transport membrane protein
VITAVMLGAFMIFDLKPGPLLFLQHIDLIFGIFCALIMCDVALRLVGMAVIRYAQRLTTGIPTSIIFPSIVILCIFGSYSINNNLFDVLVMFAFGIVGYIMAVFEMSAIPFLIAFVLAPMLERGLRRSLAVSGGDPMIFFKSPIAIIFFLLTIFVIVSIARGMFRKMR